MADSHSSARISHNSTRLDARPCREPLTLPSFRLGSLPVQHHSQVFIGPGIGEQKKTLEQLARRLISTALVTHAEWPFEKPVIAYPAAIIFVSD